MGFHDVEWAYGIDRPLTETAVLAALCSRTDDDTHQTFVGQQTIATMLGSSPETVRRALKALDDAGVITRARRHTAGGYRTSDLITVNVATYRAYRPQGDMPTGKNAHKAVRGDLPHKSRRPTPQIARAIDHSEDHSEDQAEGAPARTCTRHGHWEHDEACRKCGTDRRSHDEWRASVAAQGQARLAAVPPRLASLSSAERAQVDAAVRGHNVDTLPERLRPALAEALTEREQAA